MSRRVVPSIWLLALLTLVVRQLFKDNPKTSLDIPLETTEDIVEWDYGAYEGLRTHEIKKIKPDWWIWTDGCPPSEEHPGGESPKEMEARVDGFIEKIKARHREVSRAGVVSRAQRSMPTRLAHRPPLAVH